LQHLEHASGVLAKKSPQMHSENNLQSATCASAWV
jgi:hypothetical protein